MPYNKKDLVKLIYRIGILFCCWIATTHIHLAIAVELDDEIKSYISNIKSIAVEFKQHSTASEQEAEGMLIISKPYRFRCNYYEPHPIVIVGNKNYISIYDYEMHNLSRFAAAENAFNFLLLDDTNLTEQFEVISCTTMQEYNVLRIKDNDSGTISEIWFHHRTKNIYKMQIFEANNTIVMIFGQTMVVKDVADELFIMRDPDLFGQPVRLNKSDLEKKFTIVK